MSGKPAYEDLEREIRRMKKEIRDLKRINHRLTVSEENYRSMHENAMEGLFQTTPDGRFIQVNPALARIFGYDSPEDFIDCITDNPNQLYADPNDRKRFSGILEQQGRVTGFEAPMRRKDGTITWAGLSARIVPGNDGKATYFEGLLIDITKRKQAERLLEQRTEELKLANEKLELEIRERTRAEAELKRTYRYLENILASSADGIGIVDHRGRFMLWNKTAAELYGFNSEEMRENSAFNLYPDKDNLNVMLDTLRNEGYVKGFEIDMTTREGVLPFELSIALLKDESGTIIGSVCVARNLSELKKALAREYLQDTNLTFFGAEDGEKALLYAREHKPALILMDLRMPEMDGYEATRILKSDDELAHIPVIAISASLPEGNNEELNRFGFAGCLIKPISRVALMHMLCRFVNHSLPQPVRTCEDIQEGIPEFKKGLEDPDEHWENPGVLQAFRR